MPPTVQALTREEFIELQDQYDRTPPVDECFVTGEHYKLIYILNRLGYNPMSREEAIELAERLLTYG